MAIRKENDFLPGKLIFAGSIKMIEPTGRCNLQLN